MYTGFNLGVQSLYYEGTAGNDIVTVDGWAFGGDGDDTITSNATTDTQLFGQKGTDTLIGGPGSDRLDGGSGADTMTGGKGDDTYFVDDPNDKVIEKPGEGNDTIYSSASFSLSGTAVETLRLMGSNPINGRGNNFANTLYGNSADNVLNGSGGADRMIGGAGNDTYSVDNVGDRVIEKAGGGYDRIYSSVSYSLAQTYVERMDLSGTAPINGTGNGQNNVIAGNIAANTLMGLGGNDVLNGGADDDTLIGGTGDDLYYVDSAKDVVIEKPGEGNDTVRSSVDYALASDTSVETLRLDGAVAISATGNDGANTLIGNALDNVLTGLGGNDVLTGGIGADTMTGGLGDDLYYVDNFADKVIEKTGEGNDTVYATATYSLRGTSVESLYLFGTTPIKGYGNGLANTLVGNDGANVLSGAAGDDTLDGGRGADTLTGGVGADTFRFSMAVSSADGDRITDFQSGTDKVALVSSAFAEMAPGALGPSDFVIGTAAVDFDTRLIYDMARGKLWFDDDGTDVDAPVLIAAFAPGTVLTASDFIILA